MTTVKSVNVTKYDNGGSGDNVVADGFIKTVENIWMDSYVIAAAVPSTSSIKIAEIPKNKKVTEVTVHFPVCTAPATNSTVYCGTGATTSPTQYFGTMVFNGDTQKTTIDLGTGGTLRLSAVETNKMQALPVDVGIYLTVGGLGITVTGGTIRTIVKYT